MQQQKKQGYCLRCGGVHDVGAKLGGKLGLGLAGLTFGSATKHWVWATIFTVAGVAIGHKIDQDVVPECPSCGVALQLIGAFI